MSSGYQLWLGISPVLLALCGTIDPSLLSNSNSIIQEISSLSFLAYLGIILTLSISLLVQIFFLVNKHDHILEFEERSLIRTEIRNTAKYLVAIFELSTLIVFSKSVIDPDLFIWIFLSAFQIWLILFYILILYDVVMAVFEFET